MTGKRCPHCGANRGYQCCFGDPDVLAMHSNQVFEFRLAQRLGCTAQQLRATVPAKELRRWRQHARIVIESAGRIKPYGPDGA